MSTRVGPYSRERHRVRNYLGMRLKKEVTNSIQEEVMSTYSPPKSYDIKGFGHLHNDQIERYENESRERVDGRSILASPTFADDVGTN